MTYEQIRIENNRISDTESLDTIEDLVTKFVADDEVTEAEAEVTKELDNLDYHYQAFYR